MRTTARPCSRQLGTVLAAVTLAVLASVLGNSPASAAITCETQFAGSHLWLSLRPDLHPTPGSPAASRLADERSMMLWRNTRPDLHPTPGSPAAARLAEQRNWVAIVKACLYD
jgi:hypothetical protein